MVCGFVLDTVGAFGDTVLALFSGLYKCIADDLTLNLQLATLTTQKI